MNKAISTTFLATLLLSGCGGGGDSSAPSAPKYKWQIIQLQTQKESEMKSGCIIYGTSETDDSRVMTASVANTGYNILFHNADGTIIDEHTIPAADVPSTGIVTINSALVPDEGYVSLEELDRDFTGQPDVYMLSVEKSLLSDSVFSVRSAQTGSDCYKGKDYRTTVDTSDTAALSALQLSGVSYYKTSYSAELVAGSEISAHVPVRSPLPATKNTLVTAFYASENQQHTDLAYYGFIEPQYIYDTEDSGDIISVELTSEDLLPMYWQAASNLSLDDGSAILAIHNNNSYHWQTLYEQVDEFSIFSNSRLVSHWVGLFSGSTLDSQWQFDSFVAIDSDSSAVSLELPDLASIDSVNLSSNCSSEYSAASYCLDNGNSFSSEHFALQRSQLRLLSHADSRVFYQTIYAQPKAAQVVLQSSASELQVSSVDRLELALLNGELSADKRDYFMASYMDSQTIAESNIVNEFSDANGLVVTPEELDNLYLNMLKNTSTISHNAKTGS
ncbi:hypothetical protein ACVFI8_15960 [Agarivorans sp. MS3-6]|uniref:hypothetical protein n=1 Tax=Agarivorans sp. TSD2052 TaxID=2937286 RepID=UPI00200C69FE|nr:hypothetical protein [Agarivorans sp. TSD2052]UPW17644.1 hypothetical protein M0C34_15550 [Agarivorans sp. TSD2052]